MEPHAVPEVWVVDLDPADVFVDITDVFDRKVAALSAHTSQVAWIDDIDGFLRGWAAETTRTHGLARRSAHRGVATGGHRVIVTFAPAASTG